MKARYKDKMPKQEAEMSIGNLYEINQQMMKNEKPLSDEQLTDKIYAINDWIQKVEDKIHSKYYMLLCHERRDYTLFNLRQASQINCLSAAADVIDCANNRGDILAVEHQEEDDVWEIWIRTIDDRCCAYYLFPYGQAVLEY